MGRGLDGATVVNRRSGRTIPQRCCERAQLDHGNVPDEPWPDGYEIDEIGTLFVDRPVDWRRVAERDVTED